MNATMHDGDDQTGNRPGTRTHAVHTMRDIAANLSQ